MTGHGHVMLQLGHIALEDFFGLGKGAGVLGLPDRPGRLNDPVKRAAPPVVASAPKALADAGDLLVRELLVPLPIEWFGPAAKHHGQLSGKVGGRGFSSLHKP